MIESPCIKVCTLDPSGEVCLGCFRNLEEIGRWLQLSNLERSHVLAELPRRRERYEAAAGFERLRCARCGEAFGCGARASDRDCWCASYPAVAPQATTEGCLCPRCLAAAGLEQAHG